MGDAGVGLAPCGVVQGDPVWLGPVGCLIFEHQILGKNLVWHLSKYGIFQILSDSPTQKGSLT